MFIPRWELALTEVSDTSRLLCVSGQQYFTSISSANRFSPTLGAFKASTRHLQEREGLFLIQKSSVSHSGSIESRDIFLRLGNGTSNCTPILYHLSLTECNALMAAFNVSAVPVGKFCCHVCIQYAVLCIIITLTQGLIHSVQLWIVEVHGLHQLTYSSVLPFWE